MFCALLLAGMTISAGLTGSETPDGLSRVDDAEWGTAHFDCRGEGNKRWSGRRWTGSTDLPEFVRAYSQCGIQAGAARKRSQVETTVSISTFARRDCFCKRLSLCEGVITEWYPQASDGAHARCMTRPLEQQAARREHFVGCGDVAPGLRVAFTAE